MLLHFFVGGTGMMIWPKKKKKKDDMVAKCRLNKDHINSELNVENTIKLATESYIK